MSSYENCREAFKLDIIAVLGCAFAMLKQHWTTALSLAVTLVMVEGGLRALLLWPGYLPFVELEACLEGFSVLMLQGPLSYTIVCHLRGEKVDASSALGQAFFRFGTLIVLALLLKGIFWGILSLAVGEDRIVVVILLILGIPFLLIWCVSVSACVMEGLGPVDSIRRSMELTRGSRIRILFISAILIASVAFAAILTIFLMEDVLRDANVVFKEGVRFISLIVLMILMLSLYMLPGTLYYHLHVLKEKNSMGYLIRTFK